jgi:formiminoglutamate deiminase
MRQQAEHVTYWCELAWLPPGRVAERVAITVDGTRISSIAEGVAPSDGDERLAGLVLPGLANAHSHAFHRALRGRTHARTGGRGSFWTWREQMYAVADRLDPDSYLTLARAVFAEMALAGITTVGEFHYLHHASGGSPYADPNEMGHALVTAARDAGLRITLLDTCYLAGGFDRPLEGPQRRFGDGDAGRWAERVAALHAAYAGSPDVVVGAAAHSVRAVPADQLATVAGWAASVDAPVHVHVSEQPGENVDCLAAHGRTPTQLLADHDLLGPRATAVHATHLDDADVASLATTATTVCLCPTTERDLADGIGPAVRLRDAGVALSLGSDSHAVIDLFEEARAVELDERLARLSRGHFAAGTLLDAATTAGHASLGFPDAGRLAVGGPADLVAVSLASVRTSGAVPASAADAVVFGATAADVRDVVSCGRRVVRDGSHALGDVGLLLRNAVHSLL